MFYEKMTKHKIQVNSGKYKEDIKKIINAMLKEDKKFEHYDFYKEDYDIFIHSILGKLIAINTLPIIIEVDDPLPMDKTIFIQKNRKSVIEMMNIKLEKINQIDKIETLQKENITNYSLKKETKTKNKKLKLDI